jgi:hydrogenase nickel incorporation protein HypB
MCEDCGCGDSELVPVDVHEHILAGNDARAAHLREHFVEAGVLAINLMGSPGSGKTAVLEATARHAAKHLRLGAVSGDLATDRDARRLTAAGITAATITTGSACHLDARLVHDVLHELPWRELDMFFIENVGNLVCPAIYDLGQAANVVALSVTEGEDKPLKYPVMFRRADLVLLTKVDLLPHLDVDVAAIHDALARVMPEPRVIAVSGKTGEGIAEWLAWLETRRPARTAPAHAQAHAHSHG